MRSPAPVTLVWRRSRLAAVLVLASYGATAALAVALPLPLALRAGIAGCAALACAATLRRTIGRRAPLQCRVDLERRMVVTARDGTVRRGSVLADSYVGPWLTTIVWRPDGARRVQTLLILGDMLTADEFRRVRVVLRYGRAPAAEAGRSGVDAA
jgi:hypothetical protein